MKKWNKLQCVMFFKRIALAALFSFILTGCHAGCQAGAGAGATVPQHKVK